MSLTKLELKQMTFKELRDANVTRCKDVFHYIRGWSPTDWACAMAGEVGEACNYIKKLRRIGEGYPGDDEMCMPDTAETRHLIGEIGKELADTVIYADLLAAALGLDLSQCIHDKFNEVSDRTGSKIKL